MKHKLIAILNQDSGYLMIDLANAFQQAGYQVSLVTGRVVQRNTPFHPDVSLKKIITHNRSSSFKRILTWSVGFFQLVLLNNRHQP